MRELSGRVAVVTGAASGIGAALAHTFAGEGMKVVLADVEESALTDAARALSEAGHDVTPVVTDVTKAEDLQSLARATLGVSLSPVTGKVIAQTITGEQPDVDLQPFSPDRYA